MGHGRFPRAEIPDGDGGQRLQAVEWPVLNGLSLIMVS